MSLPISPGDTLGGKYRVDSVLGVGGMGMVVAAHHLMLDERVAIKFLLPDAAQSSDAVARFAREARAAAKIHGEHVVRVSDVGTLPDGAAYIVMEYLEGVDLKTEIDQRGPLPCDEVVELILQALEAMAEAHSLGIIHRDLKPANLFLARRRGGAICLKVVDFGISRMSDALASGAAGGTATGSVLGTPLYMAPEQWASAKHADARSDIWSLGAILYHALSGRAPFAGDSLPALWTAISNETPAPLRTLRADVPPELDLAVARCLAKKPTERFTSVADLARALKPVAPARARASLEHVLALSTTEGGGSSASHDAPPEPIGSSGPRTVTAYGFGTLGRKAGAKNTGRLVAGGAVALIIVVSGGWLLVTRGSPGSPAPEGTSSNAVSSNSAPPAVSIPPSTIEVPASIEIPPSAYVAPIASLNAAPFASPTPPASSSASAPTPGSPAVSPHSAPPLTRPAPGPRAPTRPLPPAPKKPNADKFE